MIEAFIVYFIVVAGCVAFGIILWNDLVYLHGNIIDRLKAARAIKEGALNDHYPR